MRLRAAGLLLTLLGSAAAFSCGEARADTMTGSLVFPLFPSPFNTANFYDPANGGGTVPGDSNGSSVTVTLVGGAATFGYQDSFDIDTAAFTVTGLVIQDVVLSNANPWIQTFTASTTGYFTGLSLVSDTFSPAVTWNLDQTDTTLTVKFDGRPDFTETTFDAVFAFAPVPGPIAGAGVPGLMLVGGLIGWWRRKRTLEAAV